MLQGCPACSQTNLQRRTSAEQLLLGSPIRLPPPCAALFPLQLPQSKRHPVQLAPSAPSICLNMCGGSMAPLAPCTAPNTCAASSTCLHLPRHGAQPLQYIPHACTWS